MGNSPPGDSFFRWLGRQVGHVKSAVKHNPVKAPAPVLPDQVKTGGAKPPGGTAKPQAGDEKIVSPTVVYRTDQVEEVPHPTDPKLKLRRTVIDEVIVDKKESTQ